MILYDKYVIYTCLHHVTFKEIIQGIIFKRDIGTEREDMSHKPH